MPKPLSSEETAEFHKCVESLLTSGSVDSIHRELDQIRMRAPFKIRVKVVYSAADPAQTMDSCLDNTDLSIGHASRRTVRAPIPWRLARPSRDVAGYVLTGGVGRERVSEFSIPFALLPTSFPGVRMAVTIATSDAWRILKRFFRQRYPFLSPVSLSQRELVSGVESYRDNVADSFQLRVREYSATERGASREVRRSIREWTDESLMSTLLQVQDRQQTLRSIRFELFRRINDRVDVTASLSAKVSKVGEVSLSGRFGLAHKTVLAHMVSTGARKLEMYRGRGLRERRYTVAPLQIRFPTAVLERDGEPVRLLETVRTFPNSMYSIQHGNPYIHVRVMDGYDGSGFDIWAVTGDALVVVPRQKASEAAVERLITHLSDEFVEGVVGDYVTA